MNFDNKILWIWLQKAMGYGAKTDDFLAAFDYSIEKIFEAKDIPLRINGMSEKQLERLRRFKRENAEHILNVCNVNGWGIVTPDSPEYPHLLRNIPDYPLVLYTRGRLDCLRDRLSIAIVGARNATPNSIEVATRLSASVAKAGAVIVSGGANGIDSAAHNGALFAGGKTVSVMGCGLDYPYLTNNEDMRRKIEKNGAVISEYAPTTPPRPSNFPIRNRIISALSYGLVVIEASEKSGSLITANLASEQGRDIFAVPGDPMSGAFTGANKLIRDGATPVFSAADVLEGYAVRYPDLIDAEKIERVLPPINNVKGGNVPQNTHKIKSSSGANKQKMTAKNENNNSSANKDGGEKIHLYKELDADASSLAKELYDLIKKEPIHMDDAVRLTGKTVPELLAAFTELEFTGAVRMREGKKYYPVD